MISVRPADPADDDALWKIIQPIIRAGETYALPRDFDREQSLAFWRPPGHSVFVAHEDNQILGSYFLRPNYRGGGSHVANCGYITASEASNRGVGSAMCAHSLQLAKSLGFRAMQFNFVVSTNHCAVKLWQKFGFDTVGRLPQAFLHPTHGYVDALVMYRQL